VGARRRGCRAAIRVGPINFHYHANVSGISNDGIAEMLDAHGDKMFDFFRGKLRRMGQNV